MMKRPDGFAIKGDMYPSCSIRTEVAMHEYIRELEAEIVAWGWQVELEAAAYKESLAEVAKLKKALVDNWTDDIDSLRKLVGDEYSDEELSGAALLDAQSD